MIYRSRRREFDAGALVFVGMILFSIAVIICVAINEARSAEYRHIEKMEQIKACREEE